MVESVKSRAEEKFSAIQKKDKEAMNEKEAALQERAEHVARLRGLRLAKEVADKKAAEKATAEKAAAKDYEARLQVLRLAKKAADKKAAEKATAEKAAAKKKKSSRLPRAHRQM